MSKHIIHKVGDIKIQAYNNGSYAYISDQGILRNIPSELGKKILNIKLG